MLHSKDIDKLKDIIDELEIKVDIYRNVCLDSKSIAVVVGKIDLYLEGRGYKMRGSDG